MVWESEYPVWERCYPRGKSILDIGADPESISFFKAHGSETVHAIGDEYGSHVDAWKMDIDGGEWGGVIETHNFIPKLTLIHDWKTGVRIYRLDKGKQIRRPLWKRFRLWLAIRRRLRIGPA